MLRTVAAVILGLALGGLPVGCGDDADIATVCTKLRECGKSETPEACDARIQALLDSGETTSAAVAECASCSVGKTCDAFEAQCHACD